MVEKEATKAEQDSTRVLKRLMPSFKQKSKRRGYVFTVEEEEQEEGGEGATGDPKKEKKSLDSDESDEDDEDYQQKRKGVEGLIDIENPNRVIQTTKKVTQLDLDGPKELSRREREEIEKQKAKERYMKMHLAGKTEQAKADLARLAIIRKQREEAARKKEEERKG
ncbi:Pdap1 [Columba livia]|nr:Pdap1 [Columba livia]